MQHAPRISNGPPLYAVIAARELRLAVLAADEKLKIWLAELVNPLDHRLRRYPKRKFRPETAIDCKRKWYAELPAFPFHVGVGFERTRREMRLAGMRFMSSLYKDDEWTSANWEYGIALNEITLTIGETTFQATTKPLVVFSAHALARRVERGDDCKAGAVLHDMQSALTIDRLELKSHDRLTLDTTSGGQWLCRRMEAGFAGKPTRLLAVRSYLGRRELALKS